MITTFLCLLTTPAHATTYDVELAVPSQFPTWMDPDSTYGAARALVPAEEANFSISSSDPLVECAVSDGWVIVRMYASAEDYPSLPFEASCSYGGNTMNIDVVAMSAATDPSLQSRSISTLTQSVVIGKMTGAIITRNYRLPSTNSFVTGNYTLSNMPGAKCYVANNTGGGQRVTVRHPKGAPAGTGTCALPKVGGGTYTLTVQVTISNI